MNTLSHSQHMNTLTDPRWTELLAPEWKKNYMQTLRAKMRQARAQKHRIYPADIDCFSAFNHTPFDTVKVVILGQDPYHGPGQAHGLSFSVPHGIPRPPSLQNIFKELVNDAQKSGYKGRPSQKQKAFAPHPYTERHKNAALLPSHGCLTAWAQQGVLLLNAVLSVEAGRPASHRDWGWENLTDRAIQLISQHRQHVVFLLWGAYAQKKRSLIDEGRHLALCAPHPSPLSAHRGFLGCRHFSKTNRYLIQHGHKPIKWLSSLKL